MAENMSSGISASKFSYERCAAKLVRWVEKGEERREDITKWLLGRSSLSLICDLLVLVNVNE
jgi:hypothetical protein